MLKGMFLACRKWPSHVDVSIAQTKVFYASSCEFNWPPFFELLLSWDTNRTNLHKTSTRRVSAMEVQIGFDGIFSPFYLSSATAFFFFLEPALRNTLGIGSSFF